MKLLKLKDLVNNCPCSYGDDIGKYNDVIPVVKVSNVSGEGYFKKNFEKRSFPSKKLDKLLAQEGDLLVVKSSGSKLNILSGKTAIVNRKLSKNIVSSNFLLRLSPRKDKVLPKYLWYLLNSQISRNYVKTIVGATTYPNIKWDLYSKHPVPYVDVYRQKSIVQKLDIANNLRQKRKEQLALLDDYLKSVFLDMFGDPVKNCKQWETVFFSKGIDSIKYGISIPPEFSEFGYPFIRATNIKNGGIKSDNMLFISELEAKKIMKCKLNFGDVIIVRSGANTGDNAVVNTEYEGAYAAYDIIIRMNNLFHPIFINGILNSVYKEAVILPLTRRAGQPHLNTTQINNLPIYLPPIELQNKFADIVKQVEKTKQKMLASLEEMDNHFNALMRSYFK